MSEDAAAEFRRVIGVMSEDADLSHITQKIREQFAVKELLSVSEMIDALMDTNLEGDARELVKRRKFEFYRYGHLTPLDQDNLIKIYHSIFSESSGQSDPFQMSETAVIRELRNMGFAIISPAGGPYPISRHGSAIGKPRNLYELQEFLKQKRGKDSGPN